MRKSDNIEEHVKNGSRHIQGKEISNRRMHEQTKPKDNDQKRQRTRRQSAQVGKYQEGTNNKRTITKSDTIVWRTNERRGRRVQASMDAAQTHEALKKRSLHKNEICEEEREKPRRSKYNEPQQTTQGSTHSKAQAQRKPLTSCDTGTLPCFCRRIEKCE